MTLTALPPLQTNKQYLCCASSSLVCRIGILLRNQAQIIRCPSLRCSRTADRLQMIFKSLIICTAKWYWAPMETKWTLRSRLNSANGVLVYLVNLAAGGRLKWQDLRPRQRYDRNGATLWIRPPSLRRQ